MTDKSTLEKMTDAEKVGKIAGICFGNDFDANAQFETNAGGHPCVTVWFHNEGKAYSACLIMEWDKYAPSGSMLTLSEIINLLEFIRDNPREAE